MGTIVLPPQDCLSSPHNRQNSYLSSVRSDIGRRCLQAVMVPSPAAQDCARHNHSGGSPPGDGLLPKPPLINGQARVLSKRSSQSKAPFVPAPSNRLPRTFRESSPPRMMTKLPRSSSAILPTPLVGSPPLAEGLLKGRLPLKVVQGNGPGNNNDNAQGNTPKKPTNQKHGGCKKTAITSSRSSNVKAGSEKSKSTLKQFQDGSVVGGQYKQNNARIRKSLERSNSGKEVREKVEMKTDFPVVTILQRPKTDEAAVELFTKFFQNGAQRCLSLANDEMESVSEKSEKLCLKANDSEVENQYAELSESELSEGSMQKTVSSLSLVNSSNGSKQFALAGVGDITGPVDLQTHLDTDNLHASKAPVLEAGCEELAPWERWAGPSYINSPPPSALPLPRFSKKQLKFVASENTCAEHAEENICDQFSTPPSSISPLFTSLTRQRYLNINSDAVATATKDLKRILNLDLCRM